MVGRKRGDGDAEKKSGIAKEGIVITQWLRAAAFLSN